MLRWWTSEEQAKQSPPVPTHSADEEEGIESEKGSWAAGTELHAYDMFGRIEAVRRESGLPVWAVSPTDRSFFCTVGILSWRQKPEQFRQWSDRSSVREIWALSWREQNHMEILNPQISLYRGLPPVFMVYEMERNGTLTLNPSYVL